MPPGAGGKIVSQRKPNVKKQRHLRKEVNRLHQSALTNDLITLSVSQNAPMFCRVMNCLIAILAQKEVEIHELAAN